jgi:hypothetical protein
MGFSVQQNRSDSLKSYSVLALEIPVGESDVGK